LTTVDAAESAKPQWRAGAIACLLITVAIVVATYAPQLGAPFELQDDHRIIEPVVSAQPVSAQPGVIRSWVSAVRDDVYSIGRFRPVSQIFEVFGPRILGPNAVVWRSWLLLLAVAVAILLFVFALKVWDSPLAAAVFVLVALLAPDPGPTAAWYRLGPKESWGMLLLAGGLVTIALQAGRRSRMLEILSFALFALTVLTKESFALLLPALFGLRFLLEARASQSTLPDVFRRLRWTALAYAALFAGCLGAIAFVARSAGAHSYGGRSASMSLPRMMHALALNSAQSPSLAIWFVPVLVAFGVAWRRKINVRPVLIGTILFLAWVVPQFAMHATRGGMWDHYWIPCVLAFAGANAASIAFLSREPRPFLFRFAVVVFAIWLINAIRIDASAVMNFREKARVQQAAARIAADHLDPQSFLVVVADADVESERAPAFADFVRFRGGRYRRALLFDSRLASGVCRLQDMQSGEILDSIDRRDVAVVVYLDQAGSSPRSFCGWNPGADSHEETASGAFTFVSLRRLGLVMLPFRIRIDVRNAPAGGA
jgi:hypothetical protein